MRRFAAICGVLLASGPAFAQAQAPGEPPMSAPVISALLQENFRSIGQNIQRALNLAMTDEAKLAADEAVIAKQKAQLQWWAKTWPKSHK